MQSGNVWPVHKCVCTSMCGPVCVHILASLIVHFPVEYAPFLGQSWESSCRCQLLSVSLLCDVPTLAKDQ